MKRFLPVAVGVGIGLLAAGLILIVSRPPRGRAIDLLPPPTQAPVVIHLAGAVTSPGVYSLAPGSRVADAIEASGGCVDGANPQALNLAAVVEDGQQIYVPYLPPTALPGAANTSDALPATAPATAPLAERSQGPLLGVTPAGGRIDINTASAQELETLPGIGPVTAEKIVAYRTAHGPFVNIEAIEDVPGIGPGIFARIKDLITVTGGP